jgi:hypothetical protein
MIAVISETGGMTAAINETGGMTAATIADEPILTSQPGMSAAGFARIAKPYA